MPTYDYRCTVCGHEIEVVHGVHGHGPDACPNCGGEMRKTFVVPTVHFKGSGWAKKDRGTASSTKAARAGAGEGSASKSGADTGPGDAGSSTVKNDGATASAGPTESGS